MRRLTAPFDLFFRGLAFALLAPIALTAWALTHFYEGAKWAAGVLHINLKEED